MGLIINPYRFAAAGGGGGGDPSFSSVKLLVGFNGSNGSTTFTDESGSPHTLTAAGNAQVTTTSPKYGTGAGLFDGTGDKITTPDSADWDFGSGDFTVEVWANFASKTNSQAMVGQWESGDEAWYLWITNGNTLGFYTFDSTNTQVVCEASYTPTLGQWYHIAATRTSLTYRTFVDGVLHQKNAANSNAIRASAGKLCIGTIGDVNSFGFADFNGKMDELRITKGVSRYNSDSSFTVPTAAFPRS